jgi:hypothetical protein
VKEEVRRIMQMVRDGKISPEDGAELIDAFMASEADEAAAVEEPVGAATGGGDTPPPPPPPPTDHKGPFKSFVDAMEKLGQDIRKVDWSDVARQVREGASKGVESIRSGVEKIKHGGWGWGISEDKEVVLPLSVPEGKSLRIENGCGDVKIVHTDTPGSITASATFKGMDEHEAKSKADLYTLIIEESDSVVLVRQPDVSGMSVDLRVELSDSPHISVHADSGDIDVLDTGGGCKIHSRSGDVVLRGLNGPIEVSQQSGDLKIERSASPSISVESKSGDIRIEDVRGNVNVRTANGDVRVKESACTTLSLESVSGDIDVDLTEPVSGTINIRTVNGDASLSIPSGSDCRVTLSTLRGDVSCDAELEEKVKADHRITGRLGSGTGSVDVSAVNGDVSLTAR